MLYHNQDLEIISTFKKANIADLNETPQNAGTSFRSSRVAFAEIDKRYLPINKYLQTIYDVWTPYSVVAGGDFLLHECVFSKQNRPRSGAIKYGTYIRSKQIVFGKK